MDLLKKWHICSSGVVVPVELTNRSSLEVVAQIASGIDIRAVPAGTGRETFTWFPTPFDQLSESAG